MTSLFLYLFWCYFLCGKGGTGRLYIKEGTIKFEEMRIGVTKHIANQKDGGMLRRLRILDNQDECSCLNLSVHLEIVVSSLLTP